ncbi:CBS domain-containing protein [Paenibacillus sediminis]|uniref:Transcriptional regulator n=1 Tax=Paenibacillus sediminis TaxID=664909 RepID=A0ABS4H6H1_9BACL|nr:CBS domain-containing protein [Paenibacillus sediminis]MBP1938124.1 putative transcriptional regulator [Paenibacillus sediminis]
MREGIVIQLSQRQTEIVELVRHHEPVTGEQIAEMLGLSRPTIRSDLSILVMLGVLDAKPKVGYFLGKALKLTGHVETRLKQLKVKDIYSEPIIISESASAYDAMVALFKENTGTLMVVNDAGFFTGIVSHKDLLKITLGQNNLNDIPVTMVMTRRAQTLAVTEDESILSATQKMLDRQISCLPVIQTSWNKNERSEENPYEVIGRVTKTNLLVVLLELTAEH